MNTSYNIDSAIPLTEATLLILLSLAEEPRHGYAIMKDVQELSQGRVILSTGTLYGALKRLLDQGWIVRIDTPEDNQDVNNNRIRKAYMLTRLGKRILEAEVQRIQSLAAAATLRTVGRQA